jgi:serine protease Do
MVLALGATAVSLAHANNLPDFTALVEKQSPSVVNITTTQESRGRGRGHMMQPEEMFDFFRRFVPPEGERFMPPRHGQGSGFFISADGYILTNAHVVDDVDEVVVKLHDKREFRAKVMGADSRTDVALIKIEASNLPKVAIGDPNRLKVGEWVLAVGAPFGFENSVTAGIVSAVGRSLPQENYVPFIQTDVAVNPGNSGGPLFNMKGEVVGVNSQIISRSGGYMGLSFAIPIDVAMDVAEQLKRHGKVSRGRLGVVIQEVTADLAQAFGLKKPEGALVAEVEPGSPADKAGVLPSDVIVRYGHRDIVSSIELPRMVGSTPPGTKTTLTVWRKGAQRELNVVVGEMPDEPVARAEDGEPANKAGLVVSTLSVEQKRELRLDSGVKVDDAVGAAARAGIRPGDVIVSVNNQPVNSAAELSRQLNDTSRSAVALLIKRGDGSLYVPLRLD